MTAPSSPDTGTYVSPDQLRIGLYVVLELPWFRHNFTLNQFKIRNEQQVRELRLARYRIDPSRCEGPGVEELDAPPAVAEPAPAAATAATPHTPSAEEMALAQRRALVAERQQSIANVERAFSKAISTMKNLNRNLIAKPQETLEEMGALVGQMVDAFMVCPDATLHVMGDKVGGEEVYYHSLNVTILAMMLAKDMGFDTTSAKDLGIGAMLHDIGLMDIPDKVLTKDPDDYNNAERGLRQMHVEYGRVIATKLKLSPGALAVIAQHHEFIDGTGYPQRLHGDAMSEAARLVALVNHYDNLCNPVNMKKAMTPHQALSFIFAQRKTKFDAKALQLMIRSLGVYPLVPSSTCPTTCLPPSRLSTPRSPCGPGSCFMTKRSPRKKR